MSTYIQKKIQEMQHVPFLPNAIEALFLKDLQDQMEMVLECVPEEIIPVEIPHGSPYISSFNHCRYQFLAALKERGLE